MRSKKISGGFLELRIRISDWFQKFYINKTTSLYTFDLSHLMIFLKTFRTNIVNTSFTIGWGPLPTILCWRITFCPIWCWFVNFNTMGACRTSCTKMNVTIHATCCDFFLANMAYSSNSGALKIVIFNYWFPWRFIIICNFYTELFDAIMIIFIPPGVLHL